MPVQRTSPGVSGGGPHVFIVAVHEIHQIANERRMDGIDKRLHALGGPPGETARRW